MYPPLRRVPALNGVGGPRYWAERAVMLDPSVSLAIKSSKLAYPVDFEKGY